MRQEDRHLVAATYTKHNAISGDGLPRPASVLGARATRHAACWRSGVLTDASGDGIS